MNAIRRGRRTTLGWAVAVAVLPAGIRTLGAATITWDNSSHTSQWSTANNWNGNTEPTIADDIVFPAAIPDDQFIVQLANGEAARSLTFNNNYDLSLGSLALGQFDAIGVTTAAGTLVFIDSTLTGSAGLTKNGPGTLGLLGANTFTGAVKLTAGVVRVSSDVQLGNLNNNVVFQGGSLAVTASMSTTRDWQAYLPDVGGGDNTLDVADGVTVTKSAGTFGGGDMLTKSGAGTLVLASEATIKGLNISNGSVRLGIHDALFSSRSIIGTADGTLDLAGFNLTMSNVGVRVINSSVTPCTLTVTNSGLFSASQPISGNITYVGDGDSSTSFSSANSYTGGTTIRNGASVRIEGDDRLGAPGTTVSLDNGALLADASFTLPRPLVISPAGGSLYVSEMSTLTVTGGVSGGGALKKTGLGTLVLAGGAPSGHGATTVLMGTLVLGKPSPGMLSIPGALTISGGIEPATVRLAQSEQIADATVVTLVNSSMLDLASFNETVSGLNMTRGLVSGTGLLVLGGAGVTTNPSAESAIISAPLDLAGNFQLFTVPDGAAAVDLLISAQVGNGSVTKVGTGRTDVKRFRNVASLAVADGTVRLIDDPTTEGVSVVDSVSHSVSGKLDLRSNKLIIRAASLGSWNGSAYTGVTGAVDTGRGNSANAQWNGNGGIITSDTRAIGTGDLLSIGVVTAAQAKGIGATDTSVWAGQTISGSNVLVMVTWGGDATLDGVINIDDYGRIDANVAQSGSVFGWYNGDFNYDGSINIDDYGIIDGNINRQGAGFSSAAGAAAVPEPTSISILCTIGALLVRRRRGGVS